jgi:hypothetical protein
MHLNPPQANSGKKTHLFQKMMKELGFSRFGLLISQYIRVYPILLITHYIINILIMVSFMSLFLFCITSFVYAHPPNVNHPHSMIPNANPILNHGF